MLSGGGDCWTWTALDADTKLMISFRVGDRTLATAYDFMSMRRFTGLTNAFSKKLENHAAMVALYFMYYNFGRVHQTIA